MDIIASHQFGLIEQLEAEATSLAGQPRDSVQRALTCHHVADMLGLAHGYALLAARSALAIDAALARLERRARRWRWGAARANRAALAERVADFGDAVRRIDAARCAGVLMAYRLVATPGLGGAASERLDPALHDALGQAQAKRGRASAALRRDLFEAHRRWGEAQFAHAIDEAVIALRWPHSAGPVRAVTAALLLPTRDYERAERIGLARIEARLRASKRLPRGFAANPAQAFFKLQREIIARRRRGAGTGALSPDEAVRLAA